MTANEGAQKHRVPVIDRMMEVLAELEGRERGATIRDLVQRLRLPRTTIYRILNTLQLHEVVRRDGEGAYQLGRRLVRLAAHVPQRSGEEAFIALAKPFLDALSARLGEGTKLSVIDAEGIVVVATAQGRRQYALSVTPGQRTAVHAGAASKLLLASRPGAEIDAWLARPLVGFTAKTVTDPKRLRTELSRIRRQAWAQDKGESAPAIQAFASPVLDSNGKVIAAISVPFLAGTEPARMEEIRLAVIEAGKDLTRAVLAQARG
jgi:DNA-binding IclR family transcriptional regulator